MSQTNAVLSLLNKKIENLSPFLLFRKLNSTKYSKHSANKICNNKSGEIFAVKCNCDKNTYHPVIDGEVRWNQNIKGKNIEELKKLELKKVLWILED